jgi:glycosyltransferase involved in cell wall biosynthesis
MKISILIPDLSCKYGNCLSRAYLFAKILQRRYPVELVGLSLKPEIWPPVAQDQNMPYKLIDISDVSTGQMVKLGRRFRQLAEAIDGDILYASKPLLTTLGVGLWLKRTSQRPVIADLDDWQMGFRRQRYQSLALPKKVKELTQSVGEFYKTSSYVNNYLGEKLLGYADFVTVSNRFLAKKFNGTIVRHAVDTALFSPDNYFPPDTLKEKFGIAADRKVVIFCGTPQSHKGIEDLIQAVALLEKRRDLVLALVGNGDSGYGQKVTKKAQKTLGDRFISFGLQPFDLVPEFLAMSDMVVVPQRDNFSTKGQVPIKVLEAMAMAKPVISTAVSDIPEILQDVGWVVPPENPPQLAATIEDLLDRPEMGQEKAAKAREKCIEHYSWDAVEQVLANLFQKYES